MDNLHSSGEVKMEDEVKDVDREKLNKKLLKWAGFTYTNKLWRYPVPYDGEWHDSAPDLTRSVDEFIRWIVPRFKEMCASRPDYEGPDTCDNDIHIFLRLCEGGGWTTKGWIGEIRGFRTEGTVEGAGDPGLALCLAVEEAINGR